MKKRLIIYLITTIAALVLLNGAGVMRVLIPRIALASSKETVNLRILGTTDLHGQLNSKDYEQGTDYNNGGLARLADLIQRTKSEVPNESVITLDAGDSVYDYTTEYIFSENQSEIQPIFRGMQKIGYDAITLGNHDFDYGYEYILQQLNSTGLRNITVVSNVTDSKTGEYPFLENMVITRTLTTSAGNTVEVQIGILGLTIPTLSPKTHSYVGILKAEDMVENAEKEAQKLKDMGADVIIALAHTGIGPENPELNYKNVAYALTKIDNIDVVICGHEHNLFPTTDYTSSYYSLPKVDKKTYLMNGKNVIMAGSRGSHLGVVDLTLTVYGDGVFRISDRKSELRPVTAETTEIKEIADLYGTWEEQLLTYSTDVIAKLDESEVIQNFYGMIGDSAAIQLLNDSKIDYAQRFVQTTGTEYKDYPIIAASNYMSYGAAAAEDFVNIHDSITESDLTSIQSYNNYLYIYTIKGKQLREWLEWSASAYETMSLSSKWSDGVMNNLMKETGLKSLLREDWLNDWSSFYIFDGIDYTINLMKEPRYDLSGNKISSSSRISSVTYNGNPVTDDMKFLIVSNKLTVPSAANRGVEKQVASKGYIRTQSVLSKYIKEIADNGSIIPQLDYNWSVSVPSGTDFIVKVPNIGAKLFEASFWYQSFLMEQNGYRYYRAAYPAASTDTVAPHIVATQVITNETASPYKIMVNATDLSGIKSIQYSNGERDLDSFQHSGGMRLAADHTFTVSENGVYTICAEDNAGNRSIYRLVIKNFNDNLISAPIVNTYTNRKSKISGRGEPDTTIVFIASTGTYESQVTKKGTFSYALPAQPSGSNVVVYLKDEAKGLESERVVVPVKRTGPNAVSVNTISNTNNLITGNLNDTDAVIIAITDDTVYVPKDGGKELYEKNTEIYNSALKIVETDYTADTLGYYYMMLPPQKAGTDITIYNIDHVSRNSRAYCTTVVENGPNAPVLYEVCNIEHTINGYIPNADKQVYTVDIVIGKKNYTVQSDKKGEFSLTTSSQLYPGDAIAVTASLTTNGIIRKSFTTISLVHDVEEYIKGGTSLQLNRVTDKSYLIGGTYQGASTVYIAVTNGAESNFQNVLYTVEADSEGKFKYHLVSKLDAGSTVYAMVRFTDGKILMAGKTEVLASQPQIPVLLKEVTNSDSQIKVAADKGCEIILNLGSETYTATQYQYDETNKQYIYTIEINRVVSGVKGKLVSKNELGESDILKTKVVKAAPDSPIVNTVKAGEKKITGTIELFDYIAEGTGENTEDAGDKIADRFLDASEKVAQTQTRVIAQIGIKLYEGTISDDGKFTIKVPAQEKGTKIQVWGVNKGGKGPLSEITVE